MSEIRDLTGLELATNLEKLDLWGNEVADVSPLSRSSAAVGPPGLGATGSRTSHRSQRMVGLRNLSLTDNPISDLSPLRELRRLQSLFVGGADHGISDVSALGELTNLRSLQAANLGIVDLSLLSGLVQLRSLSIPNNPVADLSPLRDMTRLGSLDVSGTAVSDLSPLSDLQLQSLFINRTNLSLDDVLGLPRSRQSARPGDRSTGTRGHIRALGVGGARVVESHGQPGPGPVAVERPGPPPMVAPRGEQPIRHQRHQWTLGALHAGSAG